MMRRAEPPRPDTAACSPEHSPADDAALVEACRRGETGAWQRLVQRFERLIFTVPRRAGLDADEAADVFQTVFMRLHEHLPSLAQPDRVRAWLVTTARRETLRQLQLKRRNVPLAATVPRADGERGAEPDPVDPGPLPEQLLQELQLRHRARTALAHLEEPCRSLLGLLYGGEDSPSYADVAAQLAMPIGSVGPTRARCLDKLRGSMQQMR